MGCGSFTMDSFVNYSRSVGKVYSSTTKRVVNQTFTEHELHKSLRPKNIMRECVNDTEHPNTVPVILGLDVTGSMGEACKETAEALGVIVTDLFEKYKDSGYNIEFCMMGIGDLDYDDAPIQMGQFESDVRIAKDLDHIYMEHGGGGNSFESYTAAWYMGLNHTKLDCFDKTGRKGIIITMGDEPLNPYLPAEELNSVTGDSNQSDIETDKLYEAASKKFDIYHISVDHRHVDREESSSWSQMLGQNYKIAKINELATAIQECISKSINSFGGGDCGFVHLSEGEETPVDNNENENESVPVVTW